MTIKSNKKLMQGNITLLSMFLNKQEPKKKTLRECVEEALTEYVKYLKTLSESV